MAFDLDPGPGAALAECCEVALLLRDALGQLGLECVPEDVGLEGHPGLRAAERRRRGLRPRHQAALERAGAPPRGAAPEADRLEPEEGAPEEQGADRLEPERRAQDHGRRLLAAGARAADGLDPARRGTRSRRAIRTRSCSRRTTCWARRGARRPVRAGRGARAAVAASSELATVRGRMVDWGLARQIAALGGGTGHRGGASVRRGRAVGARWSRPWPATRGLALADAHAAGGGREPRRVGGREPRRAGAHPRPGRGAARRAARASPGPLAGALRAGASATLAAEAGLVMGYLSSRVLGQYDVSLLGRRDGPAAAVRGPEPGRRGARPRRGRRRASAAGSARTSSRTCSSSRACRGCASTWRACCAEYVETLEVRIEKGRGRRAAVAPGSRAARRARSARAGSRRSCRARNSGH